jgi:hypothetical protein
MRAHKALPACSLHDGYGLAESESYLDSHDLFPLMCTWLCL